MLADSSRRRTRCRIRPTPGKRCAPSCGAGRMRCRRDRRPAGGRRRPGATTWSRSDRRTRPEYTRISQNTQIGDPSRQRRTVPKSGSSRWGRCTRCHPAPRPNRSATSDCTITNSRPDGREPENRWSSAGRRCWEQVGHHGGGCSVRSGTAQRPASWLTTVSRWISLCECSAMVLGSRLASSGSISTAVTAAPRSSSASVSEPCRVRPPGRGRSC